MEITSIDGNWVKGTLNVPGNIFAFSAKVFPKPSETFGITDGEADGHVSKLHVTDERREETVVEYSRDWGKNEVPGVTADILEYLERDGILRKVEQNL